MKRILVLITLFAIGSTCLQANEADERLASAIKKYQTEKQIKSTNLSEENNEENNSSSSGENSNEASTSDNPLNAEPAAIRRRLNRPPS